MTKKYFLFFLFAFMLLLASCSTSITTSTALPTQLNVPNSKQINPTSTQAINPTLAVTLSPKNSEVYCPTLEKNLENMSLNSNPVLQEFNLQQNESRKTYILDIKNREGNHYLPDVQNAIGYPEVSPDGKWILYGVEYQNTSDSEYWLLDNAGKFVSSVAPVDMTCLGKYTQVK